MQRYNFVKSHASTITVMHQHKRLSFFYGDRASNSVIGGTAEKKKWHTPITTTTTRTRARCNLERRLCYFVKTARARATRRCGGGRQRSRDLAEPLPPGEGRDRPSSSQTDRRRGAGGGNTRRAATRRGALLLLLCPQGASRDPRSQRGQQRPPHHQPCPDHQAQKPTVYETFPFFMQSA